MDQEKFIKTIPLSRYFYDEGLQKTIILQQVSINNDLSQEGIIDPNEIIFNYDKYTLELDYAVDGFPRFELEKTNENGTRRIDFLKQLQNVYNNLFKKESDSEINLNYYLTFVLHGILVYELENGEVLLTLDYST